MRSFKVTCRLVLPTHGSSEGSASPTSAAHRAVLIFVNAVLVDRYPRELEHHAKKILGAISGKSTYTKQYMLDDLSWNTTTDIY